MNKVLRILLPIVVLAAGIALAVVFVKTAPKAPKAEAKVEATLVEAVTVERIDQQVAVTGLGSVVDARKVTLKAEVPGKVVWVSPNLAKGGRVQKADLLFKIDDRDYVLAVQQQTSVLKRARFELAEEKGRGRVAEREWKLLGKSAPTTPEGQALALRKPQLESAMASLASAESGLAMAKLNVERTKVRAPLNAFVQSENVEVGQVVDKAGTLGTLIGTDEFWIEASVPVSELRWVRAPDRRGRGGSEVLVVQKLSDGQRLERQGQVIRLAGDLDPKGRMARLIVSVKNPMDAPEGQLPLLLGAYVEVEILGRTLKDVVALPRRAIHAGDEIWLIDTNDKLEIRTVKVAFRGEDQVYVKDGLTTGDRVVISRITTPVKGMALRVLDPVEKDEPQAAAAE